MSRFNQWAPIFRSTVIVSGLLIVGGLGHRHFSVPSATPLQPQLKQRQPSSEQPSALLTDSHLSDQPALSRHPHKELHSQFCEKPLKTTCSAKLPHYDSSGYVRDSIDGELKALRMHRELIVKNPGLSSAEIDELLAQSLYSETRRERILTVFQWTRNNLKTLIQNDWSSQLAPQEVQSLLNRIDNLILEIPTPALLYRDAPEVLTKNALYYERTSKGVLRIRMGGAFLLNTTSWYNLVFSFAHELAHAIDPCELKAAGLVPVVYQNLVSCFVQSGWLEAEASQCNSQEKVSEIFADWVAVQIMSAAFRDKAVALTDFQRAKAAISMTRDLCAKSEGIDSLDLRKHPGPEIRIDRVAWNSPILRQSIGCSAEETTQYCTLSSTHLNKE